MVCCPWFDKLTMRFDRFYTSNLVLSLSKDGANIWIVSAARYRPEMIWSLAFSAIMIVGAFVLPEVIEGITDASATRRPLTPRTLNEPSTTAPSSAPIRQVPTG